MESKKKTLASLAMVWLVATTASAEQKLKMSDLPAAVQATVKAETVNATVLGISKETEKGETVFEVETKVVAKTRDFVVDAAGKVIEVEEETDLASVPAAVKATIDKQSEGGASSRTKPRWR
ncbi:MAG: hypothetical protein ABI665_10910 [Vicinamibacterales bacterium]